MARDKNLGGANVRFLEKATSRAGCHGTHFNVSHPANAAANAQRHCTCPAPCCGPQTLTQSNTTLMIMQCGARTGGSEVCWAQAGVAS